MSNVANAQPRGASATLECVLSRARWLARTKRHELLASKRGHNSLVLGVLVGVALDMGRVAGGRVLLEGAHVTRPAHLHLTAARHVDEAAAQLVAVVLAAVAVRTVEDIDVARRPRRPLVDSSMDAQVVVERIRAGDADSPIGELCHAMEHGAQTRRMTVALVVVAVVVVVFSVVAGRVAHVRNIRRVLGVAVRGRGAGRIGERRATRRLHLADSNAAVEAA